MTTYPLADAAIGQGYPDGSYSSGGWQGLACAPCPLGADWTITSGSLPPGFAIGYDDFVDMTYVYGNPTQAGLYVFTVTGIADGHSGSKQFCLRVLPSADALIRIDINPLFESIPAGSLASPTATRSSPRASRA